jgi:hypothetical protein
MSEVYEVYATVRLPAGGDTGQVTSGFYVLEDGILTMTTSKGVPVRNAHTGEKYIQKIGPKDSAPDHAKRLTLKIYRMLGRDADGGFNRPLQYPRIGIA